MKRFLERIQRVTRRIKLDPREAAFIRHNEGLWKKYRSNPEGGEILLEANPMASSIISFSYLANILSHIHKASITAYLLKERDFRSFLTDTPLRQIYRSFNTDRFIYLDLNPAQQQERDRLFRQIHPRLKTKRDVEELTVEGVWFGDLLYDSHLMACHVPTIDIDDGRFQDSLKEALGYYVFWRNYLDAHTVSAVVLSHCVYYKYAILLRHAVQRDIPVYQCNATHVYHLSRARLWAYDDFYDYPEQFRRLSPKKQDKGQQMARERLQRRFSGEIGVDMHYSTKSAYVKPRSNRVIKESPRIKILVAPHCFFDSPHPYGINLFTDFYEWLNFLGMITEKTDYDWYIKTHPDFLPGNIPIIEEFIKKYPRFNLVPPETSHLQLISEGINFGLTVIGTIGFEYAALGVPVINASLCNPHIRYGFNIHPRTIDKYEKIIMNLHTQKFEINNDEVYEYYYMAFINHTNNWLFHDYEGISKEIGGYANQFSSISYKVFIREFIMQRHEQIIHSLKRFIDSKEYRFRDKGVML